MEQILADLLKQKNDVEQSLKELNDKISQETVRIVVDAGNGLFNDTFDLASMFKVEGAVHSKFEDIRKRLKNLKRLDPNYLSTLASGSHYGAESTPGTQWLISYLLGGCWREDSDLWTVLSKVAELHDMPGNIFTMEDKNNG